MAIARKKVVIRPFEGEILWGYLPKSGFVSAGLVEVLDTAGRVISLRLKEIKTIAYVKDFNLDDRVDPERMGRRSFVGRPRGDGLWVKLEFRDGEFLEGLARLNLPWLDGLLEDGGLTVAPPDARSNTQRVFVPRAALAAVEVLGYIGIPSKKKAMEQAGAAVQVGLFED